MIVCLYDAEDQSRNHYYIMIEQILLQDTHCLNEAVFLFLAVHYVFNLEYDVVINGSLLFLQEYVANLKEKGKRPATYATITSRLFRASTQK